LSYIAKMWGIPLISWALPLLGCSGQSPLVGTDGSGVGAPGSAGNAGVSSSGGELGNVCSLDLVTDVNEVNVADGFAACRSGICLTNHFQGLVSCPYGQAAGAGECFLPGHDEPIAGAVKPQLVDRQAAVASICSCQCSGSGPGPYCTCPASMQCEHLIDDLHLTPPEPLAGSYCIPKGSEYYADQQTVCVEPNCGAAHPH